MRLMQQSRNSFGGSDIWKTNEWILGLVILITSCLTMTVVPFTRKDFGERYFGWLNLYFGYTAMATFMTFGGLLGFLIKAGPSPLTSYFLVAFVGLSLYHRREISRKNNAGIQWHSMYHGTSLLPLPFSQEKLLKIFEPLTIFLVGYILMKFSGLLGLWVMLCAIAVAINNQIVFYQERESVLDMRDAQIESKFMSAAFSGKPAKETAGFVVAESNVKLIATDANLTDAYTKLSKEMEGLIDSPPDLSSERSA